MGLLGAQKFKTLWANVKTYADNKTEANRQKVLSAMVVHYKIKDKDGNFGSAADVWNPDRLEQLFNELNPNRKLRLEREKLAKEEAQEESQNEE